MMTDKKAVCVNVSFNFAYVFRVRDLDLIKNGQNCSTLNRALLASDFAAN
jgi:hypothetical protein